MLQLLHRGLSLVAHVIQLPALWLLDGWQLALEEGVLALKSVEALVEGLRSLILGGNREVSLGTESASLVGSPRKL